MGYGIIYVLIYGNSLAHICRHALLETRLVADIILGKRKSAVKPPFGTGVRNSVNPVGFPSETSTMNHSNILFTEQHPIAEDTEGDKVVYDTRSGVGLQGHLASWLTDGPRGFVYPAEFQHGELKSHFQELSLFHMVDLPAVGSVVVCLIFSPRKMATSSNKGESPKPPEIWWFIRHSFPRGCWHGD